MADSFNKKERNKKKRKRQEEKAERRKQRKLDGTKQPEFMYVDEDGNLTPDPPDRSKIRKTKLEEIAVSTPKQSELEEEPVKQGFVKFYNTEKHFGFIKESKTGEEYFVHGDNVDGILQERDQVEFEIGIGKKGPVAINVKVAR